MQLRNCRKDKHIDPSVLIEIHLCLISGTNAPSDRAEDPGAKATPSVYEVQRDEFQKIMLTLEMMQDHLPGSYLDAINQL